MRFMVKVFLAAVALLWLVAGAMACGQLGAEADREEKPVA